MRPPPRSTRSTGSPPSPNAEDRPRPTLADIEIRPRRRLRDGSTSSRGRSRSSRGTSVASSSSRASTSSTRRELSRRAAKNMSRNNMPQDRNREDSEARSISAGVLDDDGESYLASSRGSSLSPLPTRSITPPPAQRSRPTNGARPSLIAHNVSSSSQESFVTPISPPPQHRIARQGSRSPTPYPMDLSPSSSRSSSSSFDAAQEGEPVSTGERRYTAQEKGKGRAVPARTPIEIESSPEKDQHNEGDESIQIIGVAPKRRRLSSDDIIAEISPPADDNGNQDAPEEEDSLGSGYSCPVCFCPPSQAVLTPCGHILCAQCLHSSLTAAIGRNPNPYPDNTAHGRGGGRGGRGNRGGSHRNTRNSRAAAGHVMPHVSVNPNMSEPRWGPGPTEWSKELLQEYWHHYLTRICETQLRRTKVPKEEWDAIKDVQLDKLEDVKVDHVLKGLWKVEGKWVVEGECPVCRNPLPGGYGPPGSGIGGIVPLLPRLSGPIPGQTGYPAKRRR
ncbi:hypothetical protein IAU59_001770 [Kwoniella sp. CBS 9459]